MVVEVLVQRGGKGATRVSIRSDVRVTAVGERLFPVAIRARSEPARVDWRRDYDSLDYEGVEVPIAAALADLLLGEVPA